MWESAKLVASEASQGKKIVVIVSAMGNTTDKLAEFARSITQHPTTREYDALLACGEQHSMAAFSMMLSELGCPVRSYTGFQAKLLTQMSNGKIDLLSMDTQSILRDLERHRVVVLAGFQGIDHDGNITTLGRGGSDLTAIAVANFLHVDACQFYKDTGGVYTIDPHITSNSHLYNSITYNEMLSVCHAGARFLQTDAVLLAQKHHIRLFIMSSYDQCGTVISPDHTRLSPEFYSMIENDVYLLVKIKQEIPNLHQLNGTLQYALQNNLEFTISKISENEYFVFPEKDIVKFRKYTFFKHFAFEKCLKTFFIACHNHETTISLCQEALLKNKIMEISSIIDREKNIVTFLIRRELFKKAVLTLHDMLLKKLLQ